MRKETRCRHIGYSYRLTARVLLYAPSHRQDNTYLCYTSRGALAGTRILVQNAVLIQDGVYTENLLCILTKPVILFYIFFDICTYVKEICVHYFVYKIYDLKVKSIVSIALILVKDLSISLSLYLSTICLYIYLSIYLHARTHLYLSIYLSICMHARTRAHADTYCEVRLMHHQILVSKTNFYPNHQQ